MRVGSGRVDEGRSPWAGRTRRHLQDGEAGHRASAVARPGRRSSPRNDRSYSTAVARAFLEAYRSTHPGDTVDTWDLWAPAEQLLEFDGAAITAKYAARGPNPNHSPEEAEAWATITRSADRLKDANRYLLAVPVWNYGIPYKLKHLIDVVTQPGLTFRPDPKGPIGLLTGRKAVVVASRGGVYAPGTARAADDMQLPYVLRWLNLIGVSDVTAIVVEGTGLGETQAAESRDRAVAEARTVAANI